MDTKTPRPLTPRQSRRRLVPWLLLAAGLLSVPALGLAITSYESGNELHYGQFKKQQARGEVL